MIANKTAIFTIFSTVCDIGGNRLICVGNHNTAPIFAMLSSMIDLKRYLCVG